MKKQYSIQFLKSFIFFGCLLISFLPGIYAQDSPGDMFLYPVDSRVRENEDFDLYIMVNSGNQKIAAYGITVLYNPSIMIVSDINEGADGYVAATGSGIIQGEVRISGFDAAGTGPGAALHFLTLGCTAVAAGETSVDISIHELVDPEVIEVGIPAGIGGSVTVSACIRGDVNDDSLINIIDALLIAQYYTGQYPAGFVTVNGDVNYDDSVDIIDALLVARYYVGLEESLPVSTPVPTAIPADTPTPVPTFDAGIPRVGSVLTDVGSRDDWRESAISGDSIYIITKNEMKVFDISIPTAPSFIQDIIYSNGYYYKTVAYGNYLYSYYYLGNSSYLRICDISEPQNSVRVKTVSLFENTRGMVFDGTYAFVIHGKYVSTVNMTDPLNPEPVHDFDLGGYSMEITKIGDYLYITTNKENAGLQVLNISNPLEPALAGSLAVDVMSAFHISGDYGYGTSDNMLYIINISDPENMFITGQLPREYRAATLHAADNFVYITYHPGDPMTRFDCINAVNPAEPFVQSSMAVPYWNYSLAVKDHYLYYTCSTTTDDSCCIYIIDIAQPGNPVYVGSIGDGFTRTMAVRDNILYMADGPGGVKIVDVSDPSHTLYLGHVPVENALRIALWGDYAYCASGSSGLSIIDISDPHQPDLCSTIPTYHSAVDVETDGRYVYVGDKPWGLTVIDPFPPDNPRVLYHAMPDGYPTPTPEEILPTPEPHANAWDTNMLSISGNTACLSVNLDPVIRIMDISDPLTPEAAGFIHQNRVKDIILSGNYLYVPDTSGIPLQIYDITEPGNPFVVGECPAIYNFIGNKITLSDNYVYIASGGSVAIIDVSDHVSPLYAGHINHRSTNYYPIEDIVVADGYLYVASGANSECVGIYKLE